MIYCQLALFQVLIYRSAFVKVFTLQYNEGTGIAGIHYLAIALGSTGELIVNYSVATRH